MDTLRPLFEIWLGGGWVMVPLALVALAIYIPGITLYLSLRTGQLRFSATQHWPTWVARPESAEGPVGQILRYAASAPTDESRILRRFAEVRNYHLAAIRRRLIFLQTLITSAPLLGLLGTVIGMFGTFTAIGQEGGETIQRVADGISTALITTQTGLFIALPGIFLILVIRRRMHSVEAALARLEGLCLAHHRRSLTGC